VKLNTYLQPVCQGQENADLDPLPQYVFMAQCLIASAQGRDNFTFYQRMAEWTRNQTFLNQPSRLTAQGRTDELTYAEVLSIL
jgi:hypothetical protein